MDSHKNLELAQKCELCEKYFYGKNTKCRLRAHMSRHLGEEAHKCTKCGKRFLYKCLLNVHLQKHCNETDSFECDFCFETFKHKHLLTKHMKGRIHNRDKPYWCRYCSKSYTDKTDLLEHLNVGHESDAPRKKDNGTRYCYSCEKSFATVKILIQHELDVHDKKQHENAGSLECGFCFEKFTYESQLTLHLRGRIHNRDNPYWCRFCSKSYGNKDELLDHLTNSHENEDSEGHNKSRRCHACDKSFATVKILIRHEIRMHDKQKFPPVYCDICGVKFKSIFSKRKHDKYAHKEVQDGHPCSVCGKVFARKGDLNVHAWIHKGGRKFSCRYCDKTYRGKHNMIIHERIHHTGECPYTCALCGEKFQDATLLTRHVRKHTGEKPYICKECGVGFRVLGSLRSHIVGKHRVRERQWQCDVCGKTFLDMTALSRHMSRVHVPQSAKV